MGATSEHRETVTLTGGLRAALAAYAQGRQISKSAAIAQLIADGLGVDRNGEKVRRGRM